MFKKKEKKTKTSKKTKKSTKSKVAKSDFVVKAATVADVDVSGVTGTTPFGSSVNYTAYVNTTVTEASATVDAVLDSVVTATGHTLTVTTTLPVTITASEVANSVPTEVLETITPANSGLTAAGTLSLVAPASAARPGSISVDVSAGGYTFTDDSSGALSDGGSGTGTIDYASGAWALTAAEILTNGTVLSGDYDVQYTYSQTATPVVIRHKVGPDGDYSGTASAVLSALVTDDVAGPVGYSSATFTLSTNEVNDNNPWKGRGALPGETTLETAGRFIDEGVI